MIYNKRRLNDVQTYKVHGQDDYLIVYGQPYYCSAAQGYVYDATGELFTHPNEAITLCTRRVSMLALDLAYHPVAYSRISPRWRAALAPELAQFLAWQDAAKKKKQLTLL